MRLSTLPTVDQAIPIIFIGLMIVGCGPSTPESKDLNEARTPDSNVTVEESSRQGDQISYPPPVEQVEFYPPPTEPREPYPAQVETSQPTDSSGYPPPDLGDPAKLFVINEPVSSGMTRISGTGPAGIPIKIISISNVGETIGTGLINDQGSYSISLVRELDSNEAIAITLADDGMRSEFLDAPNATDIPLIGFILAQAIVEQ